MMRYLFGFAKTSLAAVAAYGLLVIMPTLQTFPAGGMTQAQAQEARKFGSGAITVRLCPASCTAVNGHGLKPGAAVQVYETRSGWARVSGFLDRAKLVPSFGDKITEKPALWVPVSTLASSEAPAARETAPQRKKAETRTTPRRVNVIDQLARLRNPARPTFRPGSGFAQAADQPVEKPVTEAAKPEETVAVVETTPVQETPPPVQEDAPQAEPVTVQETTAEVAKPEAKVPEIEVVESQPIQDRLAGQSSGEVSGKALTWEEVQARIEAQKVRIASGKSPDPAPAEKIQAIASPAPSAGSDETAKAAQLKEAEAKAEQERAEAAAKLKAEQQEQAAAEAERRAEEERQAEAARLAEEASRKAEAEAAARAAATAEAERRAEEERQAEAARLAEEAANKAEAEEAARAAAKQKSEEEKAARVAAAKAAAEKPVASGSVGYTPPKPDEADPKAQEPKEVEPVETAKVVLPPVTTTTVRETQTDKPAETQAESSEGTKPTADETASGKAKPAAPDPVFASAEADPIDFGKRPSKLTKELLDKRLDKLPGRKSKVKPEIVIAMRHAALGLLKSGECKGIERGGPSTTPGMFFIACTDDPGYLRQFPIEETSW